MKANVERTKWRGWWVMLASTLIAGIFAMTGGGAVWAHDAVGHRLERQDDSPAIQCETRHAFRRIGPRDFVVEPQVRCAAIRTAKDAGDSPATATRTQSARTSRFSPSASSAPRAVPPERRVTWSPDRARLTNAQGRRSERAMRERFVRR